MDPLVALGDRLYEAAQRAQARTSAQRGSPARLRLSRPLGFVAAGILLAGGAASAAVVLNGRPSAPLSGKTLAGHEYDLQMSPYLRAGEAGWCVSVSYTAGHRYLGTEDGCAYQLAGRPAIVASSASEPTPRGSTLNWAITARRVAAVSFAGRVVRTRTDSRLPSGYRAAVELLPPGRGARKRVSRGLASRSRMLASARSLIPVEALDAHGQPIETSAMWRAVKSAAPRRRLGSAGSYPTTPSTVFWMPPSDPPGLPCSIHSGTLRGPEPQWGNVSTRLASIGGLEGIAFLPCADTEFYWDRWPLQAAVLLDAAHPGHTPAALPRMQPVTGHPGVFDALGSIQGHLTARRIGDAWLVVQGGSGLGQRLALLSNLQVISPAPLWR